MANRELITSTCFSVTYGAFLQRCFVFKYLRSGLSLVTEMPKSKLNDGTVRLFYPEVTTPANRNAIEYARVW